MEYYQYSSPPNLSGEHRRMLLEDSGISPDVAEERGTFTAWRGNDVPQAHGKLPVKPGLVFRVHTLDGGIFHRLRPDNPGRLPKYMQPKGHANRLDVHPRQHERIKRPGGMRYVTEGEKKVDAGVSHGLLMIGLSGVWNGQKDKELIPDWDLLPAQGEQHSILFDSDIETNEHVQGAAERQARLLRERGAEVFMTLLPPAPDGSKQGLDDFFAGGGTVKEIEMLTRPYDPAIVERVRLTRNQKLGAAVEDLERRWWAVPWGKKGMGGYTDRDVALKLVEAARAHGTLSEGGIRVEISWGTLELRTGVSRRTLSKAIRRLEDREFMRRDNEGRKEGRKGAFVLRATVYQYGRGDAGGGESNARVTSVPSPGIHLRASVHAHLAAGGELGEKVRVLPLPDRSEIAGGLRLSAPRLRWSSPARRPLLGTVEGTHMVRRGRRERPRPAVKRLGKTRGAVCDVVEDLGGVATLGEIAASLHHKRPRDLRRRHLPMLEEAGILTVEDDLVTLVDNWLEALDVARELGGEKKAHEAATEDLKRKRKAYHGRHKVRLDHHPANAEGGPADGWVEELEPGAPGDAGSDEGPGARERDEAPVSVLAAAIRGYLDRSPHDACQRPSWLGSTLWAFELVTGKPPPAEVGAAIEELGGEAYLRGLLARGRAA